MIAEGIERCEQVEVLRGLGCPAGQGFYFSRPQVASETTRLLQAGSGLPQGVV